MAPYQTQPSMKKQIHAATHGQVNTKIQILLICLSLFIFNFDHFLIYPSRLNAKLIFKKSFAQVLFSHTIKFFLFPNFFSASLIITANTYPNSDVESGTIAQKQ